MIQHLAHGGIAEAAVLELRQIARHRRLLVHAALVNQYLGEQARERLGHGHQEVLLLGAGHTPVALIDDAAPVQHDDGVGVVGVQRLRPTDGRAEERDRFLGCLGEVYGGSNLESHRVDVLAFGARQLGHRAVAAPDADVGEELVEVRKAPAV